MKRELMYIAFALLIIVAICMLAASPERIKKEMCIDADVYSKNFGNEVPCK